LSIVKLLDSVPHRSPVLKEPHAQGPNDQQIVTNEGDFLLADPLDVDYMNQIPRVPLEMNAQRRRDSIPDNIRPRM